MRERKRVQVDFSKSVSRTKQSFKRECDINAIMGKYLKSGAVDHLAKHGGMYGFAAALDFHAAMNIVRKAEEMFEDLDSSIRKRFANDPALFLDFVNKPENIDELRKLGLAKPAVVAAPTALQTRLAELEVDRQARLEIARKAIVEPPTQVGT